MIAIHGRRPAPLFVGAAALLVATATLGCHHRAPPDPESPAERVAGETNIRDADQLNAGGATNMLELLQGRFPGVWVRQRGSLISVQIRGQGSIHASTEALIMIDGVEETGRTLASINPADVQRVEVLKDGAAAIYGLRGANGVLLITTRRH